MLEHNEYEESVEKAIAWFQKALALDPNYAHAYAGLADCYYGVFDAILSSDQNSCPRPL